MSRTTAAVRRDFKPDEPITYRKHLGPNATFYRWRDWALEHGVLFQNRGEYYLSPTGVTLEEAPAKNGGVLENDDVTILKEAPVLPRVSDVDSTQ